MEYLTTHDLVWVNNTVTGKVNNYDYVTLEAAMAGQYRYGDSNDVLTQAATMLERLLAYTPFTEGNRRTAFIATLTFLNANGYAIKVNDADAAAILMAVQRGERTAHQAIADLAARAGTLLANITLRQLITHECNHHVDALVALAAGD